MDLLFLKDLKAHKGLILTTLVSHNTMSSLVLDKLESNLWLQKVLRALISELISLIICLVATTQDLLKPTKANTDLPVITPRERIKIPAALSLLLIDLRLCSQLLKRKKSPISETNLDIVEVYLPCQWRGLMLDLFTTGSTRLTMEILWVYYLATMMASPKTPSLKCKMYTFKTRVENLWETLSYTAWNQALITYRSLNYRRTVDNNFNQQCLEQEYPRCWLRTTITPCLRSKEIILFLIIT